MNNIYQAGKYYKRNLGGFAKEYIKITEDKKYGIYKCFVIKWELILDRCFYSVGETSMTETFLNSCGVEESSKEEFGNVLGFAENKLKEILEAEK